MSKYVYRICPALTLSLLVFGCAEETPNSYEDLGGHLLRVPHQLVGTRAVSADRMSANLQINQNIIVANVLRTLNGVGNQVLEITASVPLTTLQNGSGNTLEMSVEFPGQNDESVTLVLISRQFSFDGQNSVSIQDSQATFPDDDNDGRSNYMELSAQDIDNDGDGVWNYLDTTDGYDYTEPALVTVPGGTFTMGCLYPVAGDCRATDLPTRAVAINSFNLALTEVTFAEYDEFVDDVGGHSPDDEGWGRDRRPVINVSWNDSQRYINWLNGKSGNNYRLPSEAEWEYAARGGTASDFWFGSDISLMCGYGNGAARETSHAHRYTECRDGYEFTAPVGSFSGTWLGLKDMHGNVWEWLEDHWHGDYVGAPSDGRAWESGTELQHSLRGGSWYYGAPELHVSFRERRGADDRISATGFRLAHD